MNHRIFFRLISVFTAIIATASMTVTAINTAPTESIQKQATISTDISGKWNSNIGIIYQITQQGNSFSWFDTKTNIKAAGTIRGDQLTAEWIERRIKHSVTGRITDYDSTGRPIRIAWSNKVIFHREGKAQTVAPIMGWCCQDGDVFEATVNQCNQQGGRFFKNREEAEAYCGPKESKPEHERGYCCLDGEVFPATPEECEERRGRFFWTPEEAEEHCRGEHPREGWCCREGDVFPASEAECADHGGRFFHSREAAEEFCHKMRPEREHGYCCLDGEVFPASPEECEERGGRFFWTPEEAEEHCRREHPREGWCCLDGKIYPVSEACCEEFGGRFFRTREEAEEFCQPDKADTGELTIPDLKGPNWPDYVDQTVTVEGIFVRDPLPMLVTELDIVLMNKKMPDEKYILLLGANAQEIDPDDFGGAKLRLKGIVKAVDDSEQYALQYVGITVISYEMIEKLRPYVPKKIPMKIPAEPEVPQENRYAILFGGGICKADNHIRYWNDLKFMYSTLISDYGYTSSTIAVLYGNGKAEDKDMPVHYSATQTNLEKVFNLLEGITTKEDFIFVFMTNHGGGFDKDDIASPLTSSGQFCGRIDANGDEGTEGLDEKTYNLDFNGNGKIKDKVSWDEELCAWNGSIYDDDLATMLANLKYDRMVIVMEQCYSGGLIPDLAGSNRIIISAAGEYEPSWSLADKTYDEFSYYFTCAINGADPKGNPVDADDNNDGEVSMVEAFNYARTNDTRNETPWYEDSGDGIPHSGIMPSGGDGSLGTATSLE